MVMVRLTKAQQELLCGAWKTMPTAVRRQMPGRVCGNVMLTPRELAEAVGLIVEQRAATCCQARCRRWDTLLRALHKAKTAEGAVR
jgi:hypothetical protein